MVDAMEVDSLLRAVAEFYPGHAKRLTAKKAESILENGFRGIGVTTIAEYLRKFAGSRPEDKSPPWDSIRSRMVSDRVMVQSGHMNDAKRIALAAEEAEWQKRNTQRIADLHAATEEEWPKVCKLGADMFPLSPERRRPVPDGWEKLPYWVLSLWNALQIVRGNRKMPDWVRPMEACEHPF